MWSFEQSPEFERDLKKLKKKWRSLPDDIEVAEVVLQTVYSGNREVYEQFLATKRAAVITLKGSIEVVKMRLDCKSLGNDKKTRIVFVAVRSDDRIVFVELYAKNNNERENPARYRPYI